MAMETYEHSVLLDPSKCTGCTTCLHHCPTEAIRIRDGQAVINQERCIDCGECIRMCPHQAKKAVSDPLESMERFRYRIALPAPTLYAQFDNLDDIDYVLDGLKRIGFDDVFEVSKAAELTSAYTRVYLKSDGVRTPVISSACPVVVRLIGLRFPTLEENLLHLAPPIDTAARMAKEKALQEHPELKEEDIGICFISPCPAKVSYVRNAHGNRESKIDAVVSISSIYFKLIEAMNRDRNVESLSESGMIGVGWASSGGESTAIFNENYLAADGIDNVIRVLDQIENGNIPPLKFIELNACPGGCVGGVMTVQNPFIAKARLQTLRQYLPVSQNFLTPDEEKEIPKAYFVEDFPDYLSISRLSDSISESMRMMADIERIRDSLPGIDCGACGSPTCRAFAEDLVRYPDQKHECPLLLLRMKQVCGKRPSEEKASGGDSNDRQ